VDLKPFGSSVTSSPWLIQHICGLWIPEKIGFPPVISTSANPYSPALPPATLPPIAWAISWWP
jgi:hypothetical protein